MQSRRQVGALVGLAPRNEAPSLPKLKYRNTISCGTFVTFEPQAPPAQT